MKRSPESPKAEYWIAWGPELVSPSGPVTVVQEKTEEVVGPYSHKGY